MLEIKQKPDKNYNSSGRLKLLPQNYTGQGNNNNNNNKDTFQNTTINNKLALTYTQNLTPTTKKKIHGYFSKCPSKKFLTWVAHGIQRKSQIHKK